MRTAWVLSGGGAAGAIQVGVAKALYERGVRPDLLFGTSAGALNSYGLSHVGPGGLEHIWRSIKSEDDVFKGNWWVSLPWKPGLKESKPLRELLRKHTRTPEIPFWVCTLNLSTGEKIYGSYQDADILDMTVASASMEGYVEPYQAPSGIYADGGAVENVPLKVAIESGAERIFVFLCHPIAHSLQGGWKPGNPLSVVFRTYKCRSLEMFREDMESCHRKNLEGFRKIELHVIAPEREVLDTLDFTPAKIQAGMEYGYSLGSSFDFSSATF